MTAAATNDVVRSAKPPGIAGSPALWLGAVCFLVHLVANAHYHVFRDELYFIVCGLHPAFGYVDQPPLIPMIAAASYKLFGTALTPLRLVPALASAATVALTADLARRLGGGRFAQTLAGLCVLLAPALLAGGVLLSTDCLQPLSWFACAWILVRLVDSGDERWWLAVDAGRFARFYDDVRAVGRVDNAYAMPYETGLTIWVLRQPRAPLAEIWSDLKHYD